MRVLHVSAGKVYGGIERVLATAARHRAQSGMEPEFAICFPGRATDELRACGAIVHELGPARPRRRFATWRARRRLSRVLRTRGCDVALTHASRAHALFATTVRCEGARLGHFVHAVLDPGNPTDREASRVIPDVLLANSRFSATRAKEVFPSREARVVHCPVETPPPTQGRARVRGLLGASPDEVVVLFAARLVQRKGHAVLLDALDQLERVGGWSCWIAGGPQGASEAARWEELKARAVRSPVGTRIRLLGQRSDISDLLAAADVFCHPNTGPETFGVAIVEAMAAGVPVVASASGGTLEIVDDACGILVPPGDAGAVAQALRALIEDSSRRRSLGAAGPARARDVADPATQLRLLAGALR